MDKTTVIGMATIPQRIDTLEMVLDSLTKQADIIELALNGFTEYPKVLDKYKNVAPNLTTNEKGDANKFLNVGKYPNAYYFSCDDDIIYPRDYVSKYVRAIKKNRCLITIHGSNINGKVLSYYKGKQMKAHCLNKCAETQVDIPGSGVSAFDTTQLRIDYNRFIHPNMADIFLGIQAKEQAVKCLSIFHKAKWITGGLNAGRVTIYETHRNNDKIQTDLVNSVEWK